MITHADIGSDEAKGRHVLVLARVAAPGVLDLQGEDAADAIAILRRAAANMPDEGEGRLRSMSRNGTSVGMDAVRAAFTSDDLVALRALCGATASGAAPQGSFPDGGIVDRVWPDRRPRW